MVIVEQAAIAGALDPAVIADAARAQAAATDIARRLDDLGPPAERGWQGLPLEDGGGLRFTRTLRGVGETHVIDRSVIDSAEARRLNAQAAVLREQYVSPGTLVVKDKEHAISGPVALIETIMELGRKGIAFQRYKGLGEMNADQLWETTLDPNARTLLQVRLGHEDSAEKVFSTLMGDIVEPRREFIETNALKVANLDI